MSLPGRAVPAIRPLDAGELDHLGPLLGFLDQELSEIGGRPQMQHCETWLGKARFDRGVGDGRGSSAAMYFLKSAGDPV
jgi:hypothetical protein